MPPWGASTVDDEDGNAADTAAQTLRVVVAVATVAGVLVVAAVVDVATVTGSGGG